MGNLSKSKPEYRLVDMHTIEEVKFTIKAMKEAVDGKIEEKGADHGIGFNARLLSNMLGVWYNEIFKAVNCDQWKEKVKDAHK